MVLRPLVEPMLAREPPAPCRRPRRDGGPAQVRRLPGTALHPVFHAGGPVLLQTRRGALVQDRFPDLTAAGRSLPNGLVLDGELAVLNHQGQLSFTALQRRRPRGASCRVLRLASRTSILASRPGCSGRPHPVLQTLGAAPWRARTQDPSVRGALQPESAYAASGHASSSGPGHRTRVPPTRKPRFESGRWPTLRTCTAGAAAPPSRLAATAMSGSGLRSHQGLAHSVTPGCRSAMWNACVPRPQRRSRGSREE